MNFKIPKILYGITVIGLGLSICIAQGVIGNGSMDNNTEKRVQSVAVEGSMTAVNTHVAEASAVPSSAVPAPQQTNSFVLNQQGVQTDFGLTPAENAVNTDIPATETQRASAEAQQAAAAQTALEAQRAAEAQAALEAQQAAEAQAALEAQQAAAQAAWEAEQAAAAQAAWEAEQAAAAQAAWEAEQAAAAQAAWEAEQAAAAQAAWEAEQAAAAQAAWEAEQAALAAQTAQSLSGSWIYINIPYQMNSTYEGVHLFTWTASDQYQWLANHNYYYDEEGVCMYDGRYLVALTREYGYIGDYVDLLLEDGTVFPVIIVDWKGGTGTYGSVRGDGSTNIIELIVSRDWYTYGHDNIYIPDVVAYRK